MALDTRSKRASSVGIGLLFLLAPPLPDGALSQGDRQHIAVSYSGILAEEANLVDPVADVTVIVRGRARTIIVPADAETAVSPEHARTVVVT